MHLAGIGDFTKDKELDWYSSEPMPVRMLNGQRCCLVLTGYDEDEHKEDFAAAATNFLLRGPEVLREVEEQIFQYYQDCNSNWSPGDEDYLIIEKPADVWSHLSFNGEPMLGRGARGDQHLYVSLEGSCDWESEHGLQVVLKDGLKVSKLGPYDGSMIHYVGDVDKGFGDAVYHRA